MNTKIKNTFLYNVLMTFTFLPYLYFLLRRLQNDLRFLLNLTEKMQIQPEKKYIFSEIYWLENDLYLIMREQIGIWSDHERPYLCPKCYQYQKKYTDLSPGDCLTSTVSPGGTLTLSNCWHGIGLENSFNW